MTRSACRLRRLARAAPAGHTSISATPSVPRESPPRRTTPTSAPSSWNRQCAGPGLGSGSCVRRKAMRPAPWRLWPRGGARPQGSGPAGQLRRRPAAGGKAGRSRRERARRRALAPGMPGARLTHSASHSPPRAVSGTAPDARLLAMSATASSSFPACCKATP